DFEQAAAAEELTEALDLYRGSLLGGFFISDAPGFERWLETESARLREEARRCASALIDRCQASGDLNAAAGWARRAVRLAPDDEGLVRRLIKLLDARGDRVGAAAAYQEFARRVAQDYEVEPAAETKALINAVHAREAAAGPPELLRGTS